MDFDITNLMCIARNKAKQAQGSKRCHTACDGRGTFQMRPRWIFLPEFFAQPKRMGQIVKEQAQWSTLLLNTVMLWTKANTRDKQKWGIHMPLWQISLSSPASYLENEFVKYFLYRNITQPIIKNSQKHSITPFFLTCSVTVPWITSPRGHGVSRLRMTTVLNWGFWVQQKQRKPTRHTLPLPKHTPTLGIPIPEF